MYDMGVMFCQDVDITVSRDGLRLIATEDSDFLSSKSIQPLEDTLRTEANFFLCI